MGDTKSELFRSRIMSFGVWHFNVLPHAIQLASCNHSERNIKFNIYAISQQIWTKFDQHAL